MSLVQDYSAVRQRLYQPRNAVEDDGIDLMRHRRGEPPPKKILTKDGLVERPALERPRVVKRNPAMATVNASFDNFLVNRNNTVAFTLAKQVATAKLGDTVMFNPLYIHCHRDLGKSHLLTSIHNALTADGGRSQMFSGEQFTFDFIAAAKDKNLIQFKYDNRMAEVLIVDDFDRVRGQAFSELLLCIHSMVDAGRQVVLSASQAPADLLDVDDRSRSRLAGGVVVEIGPMEDELRLAILQARLACIRKEHPDFDIPPHQREFIASLPIFGARALEAAIHRVYAAAVAACGPVRLDEIERVTFDLRANDEPKAAKVEEIQKVVARHYNVSRSDMLSARRTANVVFPRQVAMYLAKTLTLRSLPDIGRRFGGRDHTTILHGYRKISALRETDPDLDAVLKVLTQQIRDRNTSNVALG